ncbi:MobA/MobL family protein [Sphingomonas sp. CGMCC 1.13654]|uniref:MobA/MobL family protein n=1 Tax=Sphingomonas chungangi TaxID=2683589 RepID=A0A838L1Y0_9SPHN|nr:MobA/MobL family protein [Sphingomonas chungangi]MBA2933057.1 MobA/MobL family protein [Sphingomonas chungangi]MVW56677.1 hypothetical protein [Sphingomonas chungangi]
MAESETHRQPEYAHQWRALLARVAQEDRDFLGRVVRIRALEHQGSAPPQAGRRGRRGSGGPRQIGYDRSLLPRGFDLSRPSPLSARPRQTGDVRLPHFDMVRVTRAVVPRSRDGATHPRYPDRRRAGAHSVYAMDGAAVSMAAHVDYLVRSDALGTCDLIDAEAERQEENATAIYTNIEGGRDRIRSLFEAAEDHERVPRENWLITSSRDADEWATLAAQPDALAWVVEANLRLQTEIARVADEAKRRGKAEVRPFDVRVATVDCEQAFDRLAEWDAKGLPPNQLRFELGRTGRVQTRFVAELPADITPHQRRQVLERFCKHYEELGCMVLGAIHRPDPHNQNRNWHMHADVYDRPARWLEEHGCWDFAYATKDRWGRTHFPLRQNKVALLTRSADGQHHRGYGKALMKAERARLVAILNEVSAPESPRYVVGTYKENGIALTPTKKLGTRASALEEKGIVTAAGIANAHTVFYDLFRAVEKRRRDDDRALDRRLKKLALESLSDRPLDLDAIRVAIDGLKILHRRRQELEEFEIGVLMARSRADTVLRSLDAKGYQARITKRASAERIAMRQAAEDRLADIARAIPSPVERKRRTVALERAIRVCETEIERLIDRPSVRAAHRYRMSDPTRSAGMSHSAVDASKWTPVREARLRAWLDLHGADPNMFVFGHDGIVLGNAVPRAVRTLFQDLIHRPLVQERLAECHRAQTRPTGAVDRSVANIITPPPSHGAQSFDRKIEETFRPNPKRSGTNAEAAARKGLASHPDLAEVDAQPNLTGTQAADASGEASPTTRKENLRDRSVSNDATMPSPPRKADRHRGPGIRGQAQNLPPTADRQMPKGSKATSEPSHRPTGRGR